jgi:ribonuclease PH
MSVRPDGRAAAELRPLEIIPNFQKYPEGSALIKTGDTWVLCAASVEEAVPKFVGEGLGWVTAEYSMLPRSTLTRSDRGGGGRAKEIQRLIGRSLRAAVDATALGPRTITVDCDVLQADAGTRVAAITGGWVAIALALGKLQRIGKIKSVSSVLREPMAAISVGIIGGEPRLDLSYLEDVKADVDMNIVMTQSGRLIEVQGTAEGQTFSREELLVLLDLAQNGVQKLCAAQKQAAGL